MTRATEELASLAATLPPNERLKLIASILATLDKADPEITAAWASEAEGRLTAYKRGEIATVSEEEVFGDPGGP